MKLKELNTKIEQVTSTLNALKKEVSKMQIILNELYLEQLRLEVEMESNETVPTPGKSS